jgi:ribosome-binding protein aMBF1 (putative translation factor)
MKDRFHNRCHICGGELDNNFIERGSLEYVCKKCGVHFSMAFLAINDSEKNYSTEALEFITGYKTNW